MYLRDIEAEANAAQNRFGGFTSTHEALGVLLEEFDELRDAIRENHLPSIKKESKQLAAVAYRLYAECSRGGRDFLDRSGIEE